MVNCLDPVNHDNIQDYLCPKYTLEVRKFQEFLICKGEETLRNMHEPTGLGKTTPITCGLSIPLQPYRHMRSPSVYLYIPTLSNKSGVTEVKDGA